MEMSDLWPAVQAAGIEYSSHASDLYIPVNEQTRALVEQVENRAGMVTTFVSQIDGKRWYDLPFAYLPYWENKTGHKPE